MVRARTLATTAVLALAACGSGQSASKGPTTTRAVAPTTGAPAASTTDIDAQFDIGGGKTLHLECRGEGSPTILLESGDESGLDQWRKVFSDLAAHTRTCAYDRLGNGHSGNATGCRELADLLGDLEKLLTVAKIPEPYLLVGTSGGGFLMAGLTARRPSDVAGLVLVETPKALTIATPKLRMEISCANPGNVEHRDYYAIEHAVWDNRRRLGDFPMTIISSDPGKFPPPDDTRTNVPDQRGWLVLSPNSKQVVVTSGHNVAGNEPGVVRREILAVLEAGRP